MRIVVRMPVAVLAATIAVQSTGAAQENSRPERLPDLVVTAGRTPQSLQQTGSAISVVRGEDLATTNPTSVVDALRAVPGLDISENGGPGGTASVRLRGANPGQTLVLIDGIRVNDPSSASGDFEFAMIDPGVIERIEVLRGPQSALYGSDAIGGVINIITKSGGGKPTANVRGEGGRYGTATGSGSLTGSSGPWSYAFSGTGQKSDGFSRYGYRIAAIEARFPNLESDGFKRIGGLAKLGYDAGNGTKFEIAALKSWTRSEYDAATGTFPDTPSIAKRILEQYWARSTFESFGGVLTNDIRVFGNRTERDFTDVTRTATTTRSIDTDSIGFRTGAEYQGDLKLGRFGSLIFGSKFEQEQMTIYTSQVLPTVLQRTELLGKQQDTRSVFSLWQIPITDRLIASLGGRVDDVPGVDHFSTWRATVAYLIPESGSKLRASAGTGGKAPTLYQLYHPTFGNTALQPEHSFGWDAGIDQSLFKGRVNVSITGFSNSLTNLIDFDLVAMRYFNVAKAETSGVEVAADVDLLPARLRLKTAYTYLIAKDSLTDLTLARRPQNSGRIALAFTPNPRLLIEPRVFFVSKRYSSPGETNPVSAYARFDMYSEYRLDAHWRLFARFENILDTRYQEVTNYGTTGRALYGGFSATW